MIQLEEITTIPTFSKQFENKMLYSNHADDISVSYRSTYTLKYVITGSKCYHYNHQDIEVSKNQYLILNKDRQITTEAKKGTQGLSFFLSKDLINEVYHHHSPSDSSIEFLEITHKDPSSDAHILLHKIAFLYQYDKTVFTQRIEDLFIKLSELIVQEQAHIDANFRKLNIIKHHTKKELYRLITDAKTYLNDNLKEHIDLDSLSRTMGISKYYLHRLFSEINGCTPLTYLTNIRIQKAKDKLRYSKDSIFEIALDCGFDNTAYFSNTFKKYIGVSPTQFRVNS